MKNKIVIFLILGLVVISAGAYLLINNQQKTNNDETTQTQTNVSEPAATPASGKYIDYSEDTLASANGTKVLFFHAPWCPQCRQLDSDIKDGGIPQNTTILKVDYDSNQALRQKYGVTIQTTFVTVDENGNQIKKYTAYEKPTLDNVISNLGL